ncbi:MAG: bifunctional diaminohydroxyphosphoribosylaminopyrimidine deaminase/5-amino-6-(5-phosphoribosylamino)uracil reductase RibD [Burkholderiaceae bacterium]|nr:bifunctional diaminohydroxyphosphoribosylaminopyrimidine deaminase/5-amino-6-(5-phosphoribosylamino)uracil reductase RibD [Rhodoferax sp.]MCP5283349.1 bifunctional diaminohydroxyphosphoribosylaminopyrimidine deaminase/5-amino-6-(5-phosphoribosylamino)uracil reductase RibD [Burkholderiaceae bacterium]
MPVRDPELDRQRLLEALTLAEQAIGLSDPNPRVGCVLADASGQVVGRGHTQAVGGPHAEVMALREATSNCALVKGGTAWVTLEPCAHHGRTPPCCDALIAAGLSRVVVATTDPYPAVNGAGIARLRAAGVQVDMAPDDIALLARELNIGFFSRHERGRPWVRLKMATTLDGCMAELNGNSRWITGPEARTDGHAWRQRAQAIVTGIGTVLADDPRLDVREVPTQVQPLRVVLDSQARISKDARILAPPGEVLLVHGESSVRTPKFVKSLGLPMRDGQLDLRQLLASLYALNIHEVHVEAGPTLSSAFLDTGLTDECVLYVAPRFMGDGLRMPINSPAALSTPSAWRVIQAQRLGPDVRIRMQHASAS